MKKILFLLGLIFLSSCQSQTTDPRIIGKHTCADGSRFIEMNIKGFPVMVADSIIDKDYTVEMLSLLESTLDEVNSYVNEEYLKIIKSRHIWLEQRKDMGVCAYHPSKEWLQEHGKNIELQRSIQSADTRSALFYVKNNQPYMFLHEMTHLIHDHVFGYDNEYIRSVYQKAMDKKLYENVYLYSNGKFTRQKKAYCCNNPMEYLAELTEAYFGVNDFYPFTRSQLKEHDPDGYALMEKIWKQKDRYAKEKQERFLREKYDRI